MDDLVTSIPSSNVLPVSASNLFGAGDLIFVSGQFDSAGEDITGQTMRVLDEIERLLRDAGCLLADVVKVTVWLKDAGDYRHFDAAYRARFVEPLPARTVVAACLIDPAALVQIEVVAKRRRHRHPYASPALSD